MGHASSITSKLSLEDFQAISGARFNEDVFNFFKESDGYMGIETADKLSKMKSDLLISCTIANLEKLHVLTSAMSAYNISVERLSEGVESLKDQVNHSQLILIFLSKEIESNLDLPHAPINPLISIIELVDKMKFVVVIASEPEMVEKRNWGLKLQKKLESVPKIFDFSDESKYGITINQLNEYIRKMIVPIREWNTYFKKNHHLSVHPWDNTVKNDGLLASFSAPALIQTNSDTEATHGSPINNHNNNNNNDLNCDDNRNNNNHDSNSNQKTVDELQEIIDRLKKKIKQKDREIDLLRNCVSTTGDAHVDEAPVARTDWFPSKSPGGRLPSVTEIPNKLLSRGPSATSLLTRTISGKIQQLTGLRRRSMASSSEPITAEHTLLGHTDKILCVVTEDEEGDIFSAGVDRSIRHWKLQGSKYKCAGIFGGHEGAVRCLITMNPDLLLSGSDDKTVRMWNRSRYECVTVFIEHTDVVTCLLNWVRGTILSAGDDKTILHWKTYDANVVTKLSGAEGKITNLVMVKDDIIAASEADPNFDIRIYSVSSNRVLQTLSGHRGLITGLAVSKRNELISVSEDNFLRIWSGNASHSLSNTFFYELGGPIASIQVIGASAYIFGFYDGRIQSFEGLNAYGVMASENFHEKEYKAHEGRVTTLLKMSTGEIISSGDDAAIRIWS